MVKTRSQYSNKEIEEIKKPLRRQKKAYRQNGQRGNIPFNNDLRIRRSKKNQVYSIPIQEEDDEELEEIEENNTSDIISMSFDESKMNDKINSFNIHDLVKKNSVMEKDSNGMITYTKTEYYKNNKKVITQIFLDKNHKIIKKIIFNFILYIEQLLFYFIYNGRKQKSKKRN
jgi:hypothetical protein